jgi:hypothetical protein
MASVKVVSTFEISGSFTATKPCGCSGLSEK